MNHSVLERVKELHAFGDLGEVCACVCVCVCVRERERGGGHKLAVEKHGKQPCQNKGQASKT